jgi:hypothetical protein
MFSLPFLLLGKKNNGRPQAFLLWDGLVCLRYPDKIEALPYRHRKEGEHDPRLNLAGQGLLPASEMASNMSWKQVSISCLQMSFVPVSSIIPNEDNSYAGSYC